MSQLGIGVMIQMLGGNSETVEAIKSSLGKVITEIKMDSHNYGEDILSITFEDESILQLWDGGQSCCEHRYMTCEDNLEYFVGSTLLDVGISEAALPARNEDDYGDHEIQFLDIKTNNGLIQISTHNEHNGYYGGFYIMGKIV